MRKLIVSLAFVLGLGVHVAEADMMDYIEWITTNSELEYNGEELPEVVVMNAELLQIEVFGPQRVAQSQFHGTYLPEIEGLYNHDLNQIHITENASGYVMVHELVHFLQYFNGLEEECKGLMEPLAYELHWEWAKEHEPDTQEPSWLYVAFLEMSCYDSYEYQ